MSANDGYIARLGVRIALGDVLFYCQVKHLLLRVRSGFGIFAYMLCFHGVLLHVE